MGERLYIVHAESDIYPDVVVVKSPAKESERPSGAVGTAVEVESALPWILNVETVEIREVFLEIVTLEEESQVVTTIEVLSPSNKAAGSVGRRKYRHKQRQILQSETHLLEIDLLRRGEHTVAAPYASLREKGRWD